MQTLDLDARSISSWHVFDLVAQCPPIIGLEFGIFDPLLTPILMQSANMILRLLEKDELIANAFPDKDPASVLIDNRLFVLRTVSCRI